ncbi:MAG: hypothetical protein M0P09_01440 [Acholeplasmataceae bacterium]|nr:hypothetical protein [Acholeplasmataceae bacterium]
MEEKITLEVTSTELQVIINALRNELDLDDQDMVAFAENLAEELESES